MTTRKMHQIVPSIIMASAAAIPVITTAEILTHVPTGGGSVALQPIHPIAARPSNASAAASGSGSGGAQTYQGPVVDGPFGGVQATITVVGKKITKVSISAPQDKPRSAGINQQAVPLLQSETLQAQSAQINAISGATITSDAYAQSLQAALAQARGGGSTPAGNSASGSTSQSLQAPVSGDD